jgi:hypothetical protein
MAKEVKNRDKIREKKLRNLKPFEKGESGNPNGRPLGQKNYATLYKEALIKLATLNGKEPEELELELISKGIMSARAGDYRFYKDVLDRLLGTAVTRTDLTTNGKDLMPDAETLAKANEAVKQFLNEKMEKSK